MRTTNWLAFLAAFMLTLAALLYALPDREEVEVPSYVRGSVQLHGSARQ